MRKIGKGQVSFGRMCSSVQTFGIEIAIPVLTRGKLVRTN